MSEIVFLDGQFLPKEEARISVFDHCLLYGDGVFEGIRLYEGCIFRLKEHLERLFSSAKYLALKIPLTLDELIWICVETCRQNNLQNGYIRLVVTRGVGDLGLAPWLCKVPSVIVIASKIALYPDEFYTKGLKIVTAPTTRMPVSAMNGRVKSCNYLNNILAKLEANNAGALEALMLDARGYVVECTGDNIFIVKKGKVFTPPTFLGALQGITRDCIMEIVREMGLEMKEEPFTRFEIFDAEECFMTGTAAEVVPVVGLDARDVGDATPGPVTQKINARFRELVKQEGVCLNDEVPEPENLNRLWSKG